jgi:archaemetzincin
MASFGCSIENDKGGKSESQSILVVPLGDVPESDITFAVDVIEAFHGAEVTSMDLLSPPNEHYSLDRDQYDASKLLVYLAEKEADAKTGRVICITTVDLFTEDLNYVFGVANLSGKYSILSTYRFHILAETEGHRLARFAKIITHELGHSYGLNHCENTLCNMSFANSLAELDAKSFVFCERCEKRICVITGYDIETRRERIANLVETYGLTEDVAGPAGLVPPVPY